MMFGFSKKQSIVAIADGTIQDISTVSDPMFAQKIMGDGFAIIPEADVVEVVSPADGKLSVMFPTGHAFGVEMKNGIELLIHIGINTVEANGEGFEVFATQGQKVKAGDVIVKVDVRKLKETYDMPFMTIITNDGGNDLTVPTSGKVTKGQSLIEL